MLSECMGICVLVSEHKCEMRGSLTDLLTAINNHFDSPPPKSTTLAYPLQGARGGCVCLSWHIIIYLFIYGGGGAGGIIIYLD